MTRARLLVGRRPFPSNSPRKSVTGTRGEVATCVNEGSDLDSQHRYDEAVEAFKKALRLKDDYAPAIYGLADAYAGLKKYQEAIDVYNDLIRTHPQDYEPYDKLAFGLLALTLNRDDEAIDVLQREIKAIPKATALYITLAVLLESQDRISFHSAPI